MSSRFIGKTVLLERKHWEFIEELRKKKGLRSISETLRQIIEEAMKESLGRRVNEQYWRRDEEISSQC
jgi:hypothetical protein